MPSLMSTLAGPAIQPLVKNNWRGKPYVDLGPLILTVGTWLFERGGILGYALRENPELLAKLMPVSSFDAFSRITKEMASIWLDFLPETDPSPGWPRRLAPIRNAPKDIKTVRIFIAWASM